MKTRSTLSSISFSTRRAFFSAALLIALAYVALATAVSLTKPPEIDEGWFASPALNLVTRGSMGTTVLEPSGTLTSRLDGINQYTYWVMPLHLLAQAGWYKLFGFGLFSMRTLSIAWGLIALASWFLIMQALSAELKLAITTVAFIALDYLFIMQAAMGRMDIMCAALGFAGLAAYLSLRDRSYTLAVLASHSLVVASGLTHPNGIMAFAGLGFLTLYFDRGRFRLKQALLAAVPYVVGAAAWGIYILQSPPSFASQFADQSAGRTPGLTSPLLSMKEEFTNKYLEAFGFAS